MKNSKQNREQVIEKLLDCLEQIHKGMDVRTFWPCNSPQIEAYFSDIISTSFYEKFKADKSEFIRAIEKLPVGALRSFLFSSGIIGLKAAKKFEEYSISTSEVVNFVACVTGIIKDKVYSDEFCLDGHNRILSDAEIAEIIEETDWQTARTERTKRRIIGLTMTAQSLAWALYFDMYFYGHISLHGPYSLDDEILLIWDFFDLKPPIWKKFKNEYPKIRICLRYGGDIKIKIDMAEHMTSGPIFEKLMFYDARSGERVIESFRDLEELRVYYQKLAREQVKRVKSLKPLEIVKKGAELFYYQFRQFFSHYGEDWYPPAKVYQRIGKLGLKYWNRYKLGKDAPRRPASYFKKLYDPRNNFVE